MLSCNSPQMNFTTYSSPGTMEKVIRFAYTDKVEDVDLELLEAAHHFKIPRLFATCELKLCKLKQFWKSTFH